MAPSFIRLVEDRDLRDITSRNMDRLADLPHLYIPTDDPAVMRSWGIARRDGDGSVAVYERLYPGSIVAPRDFGQWVARDDLLYHDAVPAARFVEKP